MEKTYNPALIQRTQRYMETHSISQNQVAAKAVGSSGEVKRWHQSLSIHALIIERPRLT